MSESRICKYCGSTIYYTVTKDSWNVGHYGCTEPEITYHGYDCNCPAEKAAKKFSENLKKCCANCVSNNFGNCKNKDAVDKYKKSISNNGIFEVPHFVTVKIKDETKVCNFWSLDKSILNLY